MTLVERFLKYVSFDTQSKEDAGVTPSTPGQMTFARYLKEELLSLGLEDVSLDDNGYLFATLPANTDREVPTIGFIAHMDTSPDMSGRDVRPRIVQDYDGGDIVLCDGAERIVLSPSRFPELLDHRGEDLIGEFLPNRKLFPHLPHPPVFIDSYISESALPPFLKGRMRKWVAKAFNYAAINGLNKLKLRHKLLLFYLMKRHRLSYSEVADIFTRAAGLWGAQKKGYRFEFYRGGNLVNVLTRGPFHYQKLEVSQSSSTLPIGDQAAVYLNKTDNHGNPLKYDYSIVEVKAMGDIELCSPAIFSLEAGQSAIYVRGKEGKAGSGSLLIKCGQLETNVSFKIEKAED